MNTVQPTKITNEDRTKCGIVTLISFMDRPTKGHHLNEVFVHEMSEQVPEKSLEVNTGGQNEAVVNKNIKSYKQNYIANVRTKITEEISHYKVNTSNAFLPLNGFLQF